MTRVAAVLLLVSAGGCSNSAHEELAGTQRDSYMKSCRADGWTDFECLTLWGTDDNADRARLLEGFRKDRALRSRK